MGHLGVLVVMHRAPFALLQQEQDSPFHYKTRGYGEGFTCKLHSYQCIYNLQPYHTVLISYKPPPPATEELLPPKELSFL